MFLLLLRLGVVPALSQQTGPGANPGQNVRTLTGISSNRFTIKAEQSVPFRYGWVILEVTIPAINQIPALYNASLPG